jgi:hypothetical protein
MWSRMMKPCTVRRFIRIVQPEQALTVGGLGNRLFFGDESPSRISPTGRRRRPHPIQVSHRVSLLRLVASMGIVGRIDAQGIVSASFPALPVLARDERMLCSRGRVRIRRAKPERGKTQ